MVVPVGPHQAQEDTVSWPQSGAFLQGIRGSWQPQGHWLLNTGLKFYLIQLSVLLEAQEYSSTSPTPKLGWTMPRGPPGMTGSVGGGAQYLQLAASSHLRRPKALVQRSFSNSACS